MNIIWTIEHYPVFDQRFLAMFFTNHNFLKNYVAKPSKIFDTSFIFFLENQGVEMFYGRECGTRKDCSVPTETLPLLKQQVHIQDNT